MKFNGILENGVSRIIGIALELQAFQHLATKVPHFNEMYQKSPIFLTFTDIPLKSHPKCGKGDSSRSGMISMIPELIPPSRIYVIP